jgi:hypothetical protein
MFHRLKSCGPLLLAFLAAPLHAQIHAVAAPQKVTRAVAVYEWTGPLDKPTAARIVPVSLFINGQLRDAGIYQPQPAPFAIQTGVIYALQKSGKPDGTVAVDYARNILPPGSTADTIAIGAWFGYGSYTPQPKPKPSTLLASAKISPIDGGFDDTDSTPHFVGKQPGQGNGPAPSSKSPSATSPAPPDDPDRPTLHRAGTTNTTTNVPDADDPDRPTLKHRDAPPPDQPKQKHGKYSDSAVIPMPFSLNDDPNRPTLEPGKPHGLEAATELHSLPPNMHQTVAVSDAVTRDEHLFTRDWQSPAEHTQTLARLQTLARQRITNYLTTYHLTPVAAASTTSSPVLHTTTHKSSAHHHQPKPPAPPLTLLDEVLTPYELSYDGLPTFVYTAQSPITLGGPVYITLVTQLLPTGDMQVSLSNVTDASHLDRTPQLRLIDAVDPDASNRASLLFELRNQHTRQFALYRLITAHAEQQLITNPIQ